MGSSYLKTSIGLFIIVCIVAICLEFYKVQHPLIGLNVFPFLAKEGFHCNNHTVQTSDGYLLTVHRISSVTKKSSFSKNYPTVYFMHGMGGSAIDWISTGPNKSLPLLLAEKGYDVWLGNNRGTTLSRRHVKLDPDKDSKFWNYSFHDLAVYDLPAIIDYILNATGKDNLIYVGYSQGCAQLFVLGAEKLEYNDKISLACLLSPVTNMHNITNIPIQMLHPFHETISWITETFGMDRFLENHSMFSKFLRYISYNNAFFYNVVMEKFIMKILVGSSNNFDKENMPFLTWNWPVAISVKQYMHFLQCAKTGQFAQYDYGPEKNKILYNKEYPPLYDLSKISMPVSAYYCNNDTFVNKVVMEDTLEQLPNVVEKYLIPLTEFDHLDFMFSRNVSDALNIPVADFIEKFHRKRIT